MANGKKGLVYVEVSTHLAQVSGIACLGACSQRRVEARANLPDKCVQGQVIVSVVDNEDLARLRLRAPCCMERDQVPHPCAGQTGSTQT